MLRDKAEMLELTVGAKNRRIAQLEQEITRTREISVSLIILIIIGIKIHYTHTWTRKVCWFSSTPEHLQMNLRPVSQPRSAPTEGSNILKNGGGGFDTPYLLRATEVEKDRLFELTDVLNSRFVPSWMGYSIIWHPLLIMGNLSLILILFCLGYLLL